MSSKKPFRVTNEQTKALAIGGEGARTLLRAVDNITEFMKDIATDLLDARELIDKQEALIKEMRMALKGFSTGTCFCDCGIDNPMMIGKHTRLCIQTKAILEKSNGWEE